MTKMTVVKSVPVVGGMEGETRIVVETVDVLDDGKTGILPEKDVMAVGLMAQAECADAQ